MATPLWSSDTLRSADPLLAKARIQGGGGLTDPLLSSAAITPSRDKALQRLIPMKDQGRPSSRTDGASQVIEAAVNASIARGNWMEVACDARRLRTSIQHREDGTAAVDNPDQGHAWRLDFERRMLTKLNKAQRTIEHAQNVAKRSQALAKAKAKAAKKAAIRRKKAAAAQAAQRQEALRKQQVATARNERRAIKAAERLAARQKQQQDRRLEALARQEQEARQAAIASKAKANKQRNIVKMALLATGVVATGLLWMTSEYWLGT